MCRIRQVRDVIMERQAEDTERDIARQRLDYQVREVELQTLCAFVAHAVDSPKTAKALLRQVGRIRLLSEEPPEEERLPSFENVVHLFNGARD